MKPSIFKTYDIRGIYPEEIDAEAVKKIAAAQFELLKPKTVVVGFDARISSPEFSRAVRETFASLGANVFDVGMVPIEAMYFACGNLAADCGMMITASHNPKEYNGVKMFRDGTKPLTSGSGLEEIKEMSLKLLVDSRPRGNGRGQIKKIDIWPEYINKVLSFINIDKIKKIKIICDASNGVAGIVIDKISQKINLDIIRLNFEPNGGFPNHGPDPIIEANREQASVECKKHDDISLCAIFDGDGDRIVFLDENGNFVDTDYIGALLTKILLDKKSGDPIVFDMRRGWTVKGQAESLGSSFYPSKSGDPFIKQKMREKKAVFGGEQSAHYIYKDFYYSDSSIISLLLILEYLSKNKIKLSEAVTEYKQSYAMLEELNFQISDVTKTVNELKKHFKEAHINESDGLSVYYPEWHFNLRTSATQPLSRLNIEGKNWELIKIKQGRIIDIIKSVGGIVK